MPENPLASLIIVFYNHERYAEASILSAFAQTYQPLEIILADDASTDGTFDIISNLAQSYSGPHKVIAFSNEKNLGVARNVNMVFSRCSGDYIVMQAGDDVSLPHRTEEVVKAFRAAPPVDMVCSDVVLIDKNGDLLETQRTDPPVMSLTIPEVIATGHVGALGCGCAYSRMLSTKYGPLEPDVLQEDAVFPFRAMLEGGLRIIDEPLVQYRMHDTNLYSGMRRARTREMKAKWARNLSAVAHDWVRSWSISGKVDPTTQRQLIHFQTLRAYDAEGYETSRVGAVFLALRMLAAGLGPRKALGILKRHALRWDG